MSAASRKSAKLSSISRSCSAAACALRWRHLLDFKGPPVGAGGRGLGYLDGKVFRGAPDGRVMAFDANTGKVLPPPIIEGDLHANRWPSRLVAKAEEDRLNFWRHSIHTRRLRQTAIAESNAQHSAPLVPHTRPLAPLLWSDSATVETPHSKFGAQPLVLRRIHQLSVDGR